MKAIRKELKKKAERYHGLKDAGIPFIVAIGSDDRLIDWHTVFTALYGDETIRVTLRDDQIVGVEHGRLNYEGKITPSRQTPNVLTTVSAVWHIAWAMLENELIAQVVHFPNPWAANRVRIDGQDIIRVVFRRRPMLIEFVPPKRIATDRIHLIRPAAYDRLPSQRWLVRTPAQCRCSRFASNNWAMVIVSGPRSDAVHEPAFEPGP